VWDLSSSYDVTLDELVVTESFKVRGAMGDIDDRGDLLRGRGLGGETCRQPRSLNRVRWSSDGRSIACGAFGLVLGVEG
jgi:hypothetical protein